MRRTLIRMSFAAMARVEGFEPPVAALEAAGLRINRHPRSKTLTPAEAGVRWNDSHTGPSHTIPHMTRPVILTVPCLPVQVIVSSSWYAVEDSNPYIEIRNLVSCSIERTAQTGTGRGSRTHLVLIPNQVPRSR